MTKNNVTELKIAETEIKEGSVVRLKSSSPLMTVAAIRTLYLCEYFHEETGTFASGEFVKDQIEMAAKSK